MLGTTLQVALGGAIGASARYLSGYAIGRAVPGSHFPLGVLTVNILGSFLMGVLVVTLARSGQTHLNAFLATGILGGFTTFSSFSLETITLIERGHFVSAVLYVLLSVAISLTALLAGLWLARSLA